MSIFRRPDPAPVPEQRLPLVAVADFLGFTMGTLEAVIEDNHLDVVPAGPFRQPGLTFSTCVMLAERQQAARADEARVVAAAQQRDQQILRSGGITQLIDRPGPERDAVKARAAELDRARQAAKRDVTRSIG